MRFGIRLSFDKSTELTGDDILDALSHDPDYRFVSPEELGRPFAMVEMAPELTRAAARAAFEHLRALEGVDEAQLVERDGAGDWTPVHDTSIDGT